MSTLQTYNLKHPDASGNQITFTSGGDVNFDNGAVYLDSANNRLGIGTTSPGSYASDGRNLVVGSGSGSNGITIASGASNAGTIYFADGTSGASLYTGTITYNHSSNYMAFWANENERMRITSAGKVGVGYSSPPAALSVHATGTDSTTGFFKSGVSSVYLQLGNSANDQGYLGYESSDMTFYTSASEQMRVDSSGRLLVGTSSSSGAANNTSTVVAGNYKTRSGFQDLLNNTATAVHTFDGDSIAFYLVHAALAAVDTNNYAAVSVVAVQGSSAKISNLMTAGLLFITLSGNQLQLRQNAGGTAGVYWSITRTMLA